MRYLSDNTGVDRLTDIHARHAPGLQRYLTRLTKSPDLAEDLVQETMVRTWRHIDSLPEDPETLTRWLFTVARHLAIDSIRMRRARPKEVRFDTHEGVVLAPDAADEAVAAHSVRQAFHDLSDPHRTALREHHLEGRSMEEIATRHQLRPGTVKSRVHYAMRAIHASLRADITPS
ncbi:sigma-70 family RNA polymerase sigma factor [Catenuloplanes japonicus]|uniref:sigma-70 family RNA polymerase sigma factor n=1 Tax=Catenuloplanes japonicus TaxID=33876 RepID=UPI0005265000|nr:sigma-70 family RNA polymerase sigma factor [Catenuloplanes japonicus]